MDRAASRTVVEEKRLIDWDGPDDPENPLVIKAGTI
jgi:hypothetical protein